MRNALLVAVIVATSAAWAWMFAISDVTVRGSLGLLAVAFALGTAGVTFHYRARLTPRLATANLAMGLIVQVAAAGMVVAGERVGALGLGAALEARGGTFVLGIVGLAAAALSWTRARGDETRSVPSPVPPPSAALSAAAPALQGSADWDALEKRLSEDPLRLRHVQGLRRAAALVATDVDEAQTWLLQEARRLVAEGVADARDEDDVLTQAAHLLEWGAQKLPELAELDVSDVLMGKAIADIRAKADRVERCFVDHRQLLPIHPITRETAEAKCEARADAARAALPLLEAHGMRLSEDLIAAEDALEAYRSVTGFQVVHMGEGVGYVTFEGNGRREGLLRAFSDRAVEVEVRHYVFDDPDVRETIRRRVDRVRRWKGVA